MRANVSVPNVVIAALVLGALAACGGGGGISSPGSGAPPTAAPTPAGPPASLARITPMPGLPTVPPTSAAFTAPPSSAPVAGTPRPSTAPVAAPTGSALTGLLGGHPPQQYYAALAAPAAPFPLPASAPKGVLGTIVAFTADGFTIAVESPLDASAAIANGAAYAAGATAVGANAVTVHVSGATADLVPGGFAALRVGDPVLVAGSGDPSSFTASIVAGESAARVAAMRARSAFSATGVGMHRANDVRGATRSKTAAVPTPSAGGSPTDLLIAASGANVAATFPNPPVAFESAFLGCVSVSLEPVATAGIGAAASYPMQLADASSDDDPYVESKIQKLPVTLMNDYDAGGTRYTIEIALAASVRGVVTQNCAASLGGLAARSTVRHRGCQRRNAAERNLERRVAGQQRAGRHRSGAMPVDDVLQRRSRERADRRRLRHGRLLRRLHLDGIAGSRRRVDHERADRIGADLDGASRRELDLEQRLARR